MPPPAVSPSLPPSVTPAGPPRRIAVIGGGISGLAAAHRLIELDLTAQVTLFEASARLGGVLQTERQGGWLIERSADMFTTREPWALDLCRRIGIADELIETDSRFRKAYVVRRGRLVPVPEGFTLMSPAKIWPIVTTPLLSPLGKLRLAWEYFTPARRDGADESLESFVVRRFGREAFDRLIQPLIGGIYTADPAKLSLAATLPQFLELERRSGSLIRAMRRQRSEVSGQKSEASGARYGLFLAPRDGMRRLVEAIAARLPPASIRLNSPVQQINRVKEEWRLNVGSNAETFNEIVLAAPGAVSSRLLQPIDAELAALIGKIEYAGCSVAVLGMRREQITRLPPCFGFVVPAIENRRIIACSFASVKFPGRARRASC